jgi:predicted transport protein
MNCVKGKMSYVFQKELCIWMMEEIIWLRLYVWKLGKYSFCDAIQCPLRERLDKRERNNRKLCGGHVSSGAIPSSGKIEKHSKEISKDVSNNGHYCAKGREREREIKRNVEKKIHFQQQKNFINNVISEIREIRYRVKIPLQNTRTYKMFTRKKNPFTSHIFV